MATNKEQRIIEIIADGQKFNASVKEMGASLSIMRNQLLKMSADDPGRAKLLKDYTEMSVRFNKAKLELDGIDRAQRQAAMSAGFMKQAWGTAFGMFLGGGLTQAFSMVIGFFSDASTEAKNFEKSLDSLSSITGLTGPDLEFLAEQAELTGDKMKMGADKVLEAYKLMGSAKPELLANKEALAETTEQAIILAKAAEMELAPAASALAESLNQFGEGADQAGRYINVMAAGAKEGASEISETAAALKNAGTVAAAANISFEQTNAVIQSLSSVAIKGGEAGTGFRNVLLTLQSGADDTNPKIVGLEKALDNLGKKNLSTAELSKMFGKENVVVAQHMVKTRDEITRLTTAMTGTNVAYEQAATNMDNMEGDLASLSSASASLKRTLGEGLNIVLREGIQLFTTLILGLKEAPKFIKENQDVIYTLGAAVLALNFNNIKTAASTLYHSAVEKGRAIATNASAIAQRVLNAAMTANPIGLVIAAVAALVGGFVILYNRSEAVRAGISGLGKVFKELLSIAGDIGAFLINPLKNASKLADIKNAGSRLGNAFTEGYNNKIAEEQSKKEKNDKAKHDQDKAVAKTKGGDLGTATADGFKESLKGMSIKELQNLLDTETDKAHMSLIQKQIIHLQDVEKANKAHRKEVEKTNKTHEKQVEKDKKEFQKLDEQAELEFQKLKISIMQDGIDKVLAKLRLQHDQEVKEIQKHKSQVLANDAIAQERKLLLISQYDEQEKQLKAQLLKQEEEARKEDAKKKQEEYFTKVEEDAALAQEKLENDLLNEQVNFDDQLLRTMEAENRRDIALLDQKKSAAQLKLNFLLESGQWETTQALKLKNEILRIDKEKADKIQENEQKTFKVKTDLLRMGMEMGQEAMQAGIDLLGKETAARKVAVTAWKAFSIGMIAVDSAQEIQKIWLNANSNPMNALIPGSGAIIAGVQTGLAVARAVKATKSVLAQKFFAGGMTTKKGNLIPMKEVNGMWEMAAGHSGGSMGTFADGGMVNDARLGLIGERGAELVIPNWMLKSPKYANTVAWLESERQRGVTALATGGLSSPERLPVPTASSNNNQEYTPFEVAMLAKMDQLNAKVEAWPKLLQVHNNVVDAAEVLQVYNDSQDQAGG